MKEIVKGHYTMKEMIGQGAFGVIYHGWDEKEKRDVAVKIWKKGEETEALESGGTFFQEDNRLPGLVGLYDFFTKAGMNFLVMEYLSGGTLKEYLTAQPGRKIKETELFTFLKPAMEALAVLHSENMVHCDVSPDNLMFRREGELCLIDLGSCRGEGISCEKKFLKEHYSAPEQYSGTEKIGPWTDVYSLCALMYECLSGMKPPSAPARLHRDELQPLSSYTEVSEKTERAIMKGLELDIRKRYFSIRLLMEALEMPEEEIRVYDGALRHRWGQKWIEAGSGGSYSLDRKTRISTSFWNKVLGAGAALIFLAAALPGGWRWYETAYREILIKKELARAQESDAAKDDLRLIDSDSENYAEIRKNLQKYGTVGYEIETDSYQSCSYEMEKEDLLSWGIPTNFGRKMYLDWENIRDAFFYYMGQEESLAIESQKEDTFGFVSWDANENYETISNRCYVEQSYDMVYRGKNSEHCTIKYDPVDSRVHSIQYSSASRDRVREFLVKMLPVCTPEGFLTEEEADEILDALSPEITEDHMDSREYSLNARTWIDVMANDPGDGETRYWAKIAASNACLYN